MSSQLEYLNRLIDKHSKTYHKFIFIGAFNVDTDKKSNANFCDTNCLKSLTKVRKLTLYSQIGGSIYSNTAMPSKQGFHTFIF